MSETYLFMSQPRAVETRRRYRPPEELEEELGETANIMFDPRVMRGTTVGRPVQVLQGMAATVPMGTMGMDATQGVYRESKQHMVRTGKIRPTQKTVAEIHDNIRVVKKRVEVPLHLYLIEQSEPVLKHTVEAQTDAFLEEPPTPEYIPRKTGVDAGTQVDTDEIFNFDLDVQPILEVVISKTLEQSVMEVRQEEELKDIDEEKAFLQEKFKLQELEAEEKEAAERALLKEKDFLLADKRERALREKVVQQKLASNAFAKQYLSGLQAHVFDQLRHRNHFVGPIRSKAEGFAPWLNERIMEDVQATEVQQNLVDELLRGCIEMLGKQKEEMAAQRRLRRIQEAEDEKKRLAEAAELKKRKAKIQLFINSELVAEGPIGPINVTGENTIDQLEVKVLRWLEENAEMDDVPDSGKISWKLSGDAVEKSSVLFDLGVKSLATLEMNVEVPVAAGDEGDEGE